MGAPKEISIIPAVEIEDDFHEETDIWGDPTSMDRISG